LYNWLRELNSNDKVDFGRVKIFLLRRKKVLMLSIPKTFVSLDIDVDFLEELSGCFLRWNLETSGKDFKNCK
jgi:hypothetical protein